MKPESTSGALRPPAVGLPQSSRYIGGTALDARRRVASALGKLDAWIESESFQGWDPYDALNSPPLRWLGRRHRLAGIALVQLLRHSPVNLRPLLGLHKGYNSKAMGLFLAGYAQKFLATGDEACREKVRLFAQWLVTHAASGYSGACWGYNFDWPNRASFVPAGTPTIVNTAFVGLSFLAAKSALDGTPDALSVARSACDFILHDLHTSCSGDDEICFSYTPIDRRFVHNANLLGAWLLAAVHAYTGEEHLARNAKAAARFTLRQQRLDGSWPYGIARQDRWVDNFHTGYVLVALKRIATSLGTDEFDAALEAGYRFWKTRMFFSRVIPKYCPDRAYPIDIHSVAQAILTLLEFSDLDSDATERAWQLASWVVDHMQDADGFFYYQIHRAYRIRIPYMRWSQAWMHKALTALCTSRTPEWLTSQTVSYASRD